MSTGKIRSVVVTERVAWVRKMLAGIRELPLLSYDEFTGDPRTPAAAESYLRRALEALLDLGRHVLAKGFAVAPAEYKEVADELVKVSVLPEQDGDLLRKMAGYRSRPPGRRRLVHGAFRFRKVHDRPLPRKDAPRQRVLHLFF